MMRCSGWRFGLLGLLSCWACGPDKDRGPVHRLYLDDDDPTAGASGSLAGAGTGEAGAGTQPEPEPLAPTVSAMMPVSGPYGTEVRIQGEYLGSASRADVSILLGADESGELVPSSKPMVVSWTETEISFRFPFPFEGRVLVRTPQGEVVAGEFEPTWVPGPAFESVEGVTSSASLAASAGALSAVLDTGPPSLVTFDGSEWSSVDITGNNLRADSIRLFVEDQALSAFALSTAIAPQIIALDPASQFAQTTSGLEVTSDYRVAGGPDGATVWYRSGNDWSRARPSTGVWAVDKGPLPDPQPVGARHAAAATSSGALYVGWAVEANTTFDDLGVAKHSFVAPDGAAFTASATTGSKLDDSISSLVMSDRGTGLVTKYCGTDEDSLGVTGDEFVCFAALLPEGAHTTHTEYATLRYGFGPSSPMVAYCSASSGTRLIPEVGAGGTSGAQLDALAGEIVAWPCTNVLAVEVDPDGAPLLLLEQAGKLYSPRPRVK